ncbi:MAG: ribonuclease H-like YkuK family protein [Candidatus Levybacteria bacterium]|nr:ribonuclease H-like YkuK family protein [Candidatus Levybacteria bacterium]
MVSENADLILMEDIFHNTTHGDLSLGDVITKIKTFLGENPQAEYTLVIGTDSQEKIRETNGKTINLITAIVVHRKGYGGTYFWKKGKPQKVHTLREKIYAETLSSLEFATFFVPALTKSLNGSSPKYRLEIHVDIGEHGATRDMIKEIVGMVTGNGYVAKTKPYAFGASYVADKHT